MTEINLSTQGRLVAASAYPVVMAMACASFAGLFLLGLTAALSAYAAVCLGAVLITWHELKLPYRGDWKPGASEVGVDAVFLGVVQIGLPLLLSVTLVVALADWLRAESLVVADFWPHQWPVWAQAALMMLVADFGRYWLHRAFHKFSPMWRLHAVHHSPQRLYWVNVGRFHPLEKAIQYCLDALPFALVGVSGDVLAAYFVFYAVNGFYQHSNCLVRLGPLNYLVAGPELHRWHHSELPEESNNNFGNNLIVWDLLFGTRFLPADREVGLLGLMNRAYPMGFWAQMRMPFRPAPEGAAGDQ
ncbi:sterol desaturase family protein [Candidatus Foliamicus sp.]